MSLERVKLCIIECITFEHLNTTRIRRSSSYTVGAVVGMSGMPGFDARLSQTFQFPYILLLVAHFFKKKLQNFQ